MNNHAEKRGRCSIGPAAIGKRIAGESCFPAQAKVTTVPVFPSKASMALFKEVIMATLLG